MKSSTFLRATLLFLAAISRVDCGPLFVPRQNIDDTNVQFHPFNPYDFMTGFNGITVNSLDFDNANRLAATNHQDSDARLQDVQNSAANANAVANIVRKRRANADASVAAFWDSLY